MRRRNPAVAILALLAILGTSAAADEPERHGGATGTAPPVAPGSSSDPSEIALSLDPAAFETPGARTQRLGLGEALLRALDENLDLALARVAEERVRARSTIALGRLAPQVELGGGAARTDGRVQGSFGELQDVDFDTIDPGVGLVYRLNLGARLLDALAAGQEIDASEYATLDARQRLLFEITELYHDLLLGEAGVQIAGQRVNDGEEFVSIVSARQRAGLGLESEVARARAKLARDRQDLAQARAVWEGASTRLAVSLRLSPNVLLVGAQERLLPRDLVPSASEAELVTQARERPAVQAFRLQSEAAGRRSRAAWWDLAGPEVDLRVGETWIGDSANDLEGGTRYGAFLGWTLSLDKVGEISEARADRDLARLAALRAEERAVGEARRILAQLGAARERLPLAWDGLAAAEQNQRISLARFRSGTAIALEVLDAEDRLAEARLDLARAIVDFNVTQARLLAATGQIDAQRLSP